jgi:hypothetical protein
VVVPIDVAAVSVATGHAYVCFHSDVVATLPDATSCPGKRILITFSGGRNNTVTGLVLEHPNMFVGETGGTYKAAISNLPSGTYELRAFYDANYAPEGFGVGVWLLIRHAGTYGRRSVDVDCVMPGVLPGGYVVAVIDDDPSTERYTLTATVATPALLAFDGSGSYSPDQRVLVAFDDAYTGVFRVNSNASATTWQLELIERIPIQQIAMGDYSETEYRVALGEQWAGRTFRTNAASGGGGVSLVAAPLQSYPLGGLYIDGSHAYGGYAATDVLVGKVNLLDTTVGGGTLVLNLVGAHDPLKVIGERFAVQVAVCSAPRTVVIRAPGVGFIAGVDGSVAIGEGDSSTSFTALPGFYREWQLESDSIWRVCSRHDGVAAVNPDAYLERVPKMPAHCASILVSVPAGVTTEIVPAPPAGYGHLIAYLRFQNQGVASTSVTVIDGAGLIQGFANAIGINNNGGSTNVISFPGFLATTALRATVTGGTPCMFNGLYSRVPLVTAERTLVTMTLASLTGVYQSIAALVPPAGFMSKAWGVEVFVGSLTSSFALTYINRDGAATAPVDVRLTRGSQVIELRSSGIALGRSIVGNQNLPLLLPGDVLEARSGAGAPAPGAGLCVLWATFEWTPIVA